jgi:hypothetical protein
MSRIFLFVVLVGLVVAGALLLGLGAFPPHPVQTQIQKTLPNDRFTRPAAPPAGG